MPAQLVALSEGPSILLDKPILLLGRHPECDIQIDSRKISRRHCCIAQVSDYLVVRDLGSTNGIRINGVRVIEGRLRSDDELTIGGYRYRVSWDALVAATGRAAGEGSRPRSEQVARGRPARGNDAGLESCDEPVPLAESVREPVPTPRRPAEAPGTHPVTKGADGRTPPPPSDRPHSHIVPDDLRLAPASDADMHGPQPSSKK